MDDFVLSYIHKSKHSKDTVIYEHAHTCTEIVIYLKGCGKTVINGNTYDIRNNSIAVIPSDVEHNEVHNEDSQIIYFGYTVNPEYGVNIPEGVYYPLYYDKFIQLANNIYDEAKYQRSNHKALISAYMSELMILLDREINNSKASVHKKSLEYCANYMKENCNQKTDIKRLSNDFGYSYDNFRHLFKSQYGLAPQNYIIYQRLMSAHKMLSDSDINCTDIAMFCGFSDSSQFSKMFKRQYGISPKKFQQDKKKNKLQ